MKLTCAQMDVLISFYIDGDLSVALKSQVEEHMKKCSVCRAKYEIIKSMLSDLQNNLEMKEYRLSVTIDVHDFNTRVNNASKYLEKGHKIKVSIRFKGRELAHPELGKQVLLRFADAVSNLATIEQQPKLEGRFMTMLLTPNKEK